MEKQERVEDIVRKGFENRTRKAMGASISDENLRIASDAYLTSLRRIIALRRAQDSYEMLRTANPAMVSAIEDAMILAGDEPVVGGIDDILQGFSAEIDDLEAVAEATRRSLNEAIIDEVIPAKYTRAGDYLKRVLNENPQLGSMVKGAFQNKGKVLAGAATAAGLAIFAMKKRGIELRTKSLVLRCCQVATRTKTYLQPLRNYLKLLFLKDQLAPLITCQLTLRRTKLMSLC